MQQGQQIAEMDDTDSNRTMLHFEVRSWAARRTRRAICGRAESAADVTRKIDEIDDEDECGRDLRGAGFDRNARRMRAYDDDDLPALRRHRFCHQLREHDVGGVLQASG